MNSLGPCGVGRGYPSNAWSSAGNIFRTSAAAILCMIVSYRSIHAAIIIDFNVSEQP
jgi:hypothetical protein